MLSKNKPYLHLFDDDCNLIKSVGPYSSFEEMDKDKVNYPGYNAIGGKKKLVYIKGFGWITIAGMQFKVMVGDF